MEVSGHLNMLALSNHWLGGWVGPRANLIASKKRKIP